MLALKHFLYTLLRVCDDCITINDGQCSSVVEVLLDDRLEDVDYFLVLESEGSSSFFVVAAVLGVAGGTHDGFGYP